MIAKFKKQFYFFVANYFRFWARFVLERWQPMIILITGSSGKTTAMHMVKAQLKDSARYSDHANSSFGIPFNILGLSRKTLRPFEWVMLGVLAPIRAFSVSHKQRLYVVEADSDRPGEAHFISSLLRPDIVLWLGTSRTHSMNFDKQVASGAHKDVDSAIADEFGVYIEHARELVLANGDQEGIDKQLAKATAPFKKVSKDSLKSYSVNKKGTTFTTKKGNTYTFSELLPEATYYGLAMTHMLSKYLKEDFDHTFKNYLQPAGRSSLFEGHKGELLLDSTYNSNLSSVETILTMYNKLRSKHKWLVIGDMLEQGESEAAEHKKLAVLVAQSNYERVILMGPRVMRYTKPELKKRMKSNVEIVAFEDPRPVLDYLKQEITGKEIILFKGARFLEGVIEHLLKDPSDRQYLARREEVWQKRREQWQVG